MNLLRNLLLVVSAPLVTLVLVGALGARVGDATDKTLRELRVFTETLELVQSSYVEEIGARDSFVSPARAQTGLVLTRSDWR